MAQEKCIYFGECGGCSSQHIQYDLQLENKKASVLSELKKFKLPIPLNKEIPILADKPFHYRNRMDFIWSPKGPGLRKKGSFQNIVPIRGCIISNDRINQLLKELWDFYDQKKSELSPFHLKKNSGCLKYVVLRATNAGMGTVSFMLNEDAKEFEKHVELVKFFAQHTTAENVVIARSPKDKDWSLSSDCWAVKGSELMQEKLLDTTLNFSSQGFFQNNTRMTEKMILYTKDRIRKSKNLVDLYGGCGTFGFTFADLFEQAFIVDTEQVNIDCANDSIKENNTDNIQAMCADAGAIFSKIAKLDDITLITDPPRSGMHPKVIKKILGLGPEQIIYISCNPKKLASELRSFVPLYDIKNIALFDLFPQTNHVEAIAVLEKKE